MNKKAAYDMAYEKKNIRRVIIGMNRNTDADILEFMEANVDNMQKYIKGLIREDMKNRK